MNHDIKNGIVYLETDEADRLACEMSFPDSEAFALYGMVTGMLDYKRVLINELSSSPRSDHRGMIVPVARQIAKLEDMQSSLRNIARRVNPELFPD